MKIDINTIKALAENIDQYNLNEIEIEMEGVKLVLKKEIPVEVEKLVVKDPIIQNNVQKEIIEEQEEIIEDEYQYVVAPMVGTFYSASAPGNPPYVSEGEEVKVGTTVCIIEAMKLMNEVKSDISGKVVKVIAENGKVVKKGDKLFAIK